LRTLRPDDEIQNPVRSAGGGHKPEEVINCRSRRWARRAQPTRMSRICSARHGDGARVVVDCRCPKAATHWPWVAGVADPKMAVGLVCWAALDGWRRRAVWPLVHSRMWTSFERPVANRPLGSSIIFDGK